jgi:hypothetical protein
MERTLFGVSHVEWRGRTTHSSARPPTQSKPGETLSARAPRQPEVGPGPGPMGERDQQRGLAA